MTEQEATLIISLSVPKDRSGAEQLAKVAMNMAVNRMSRMTGVSFNRDLLPFTLRSGISSYKLGSDVLQKYPLVYGMQELWFTADKGYSIRLLAFDEFNRNARGGSTSGRPEIGTIHSSTATLDVYPIPDSNYSVVGYVKRQVTQLSDIPSAYHDVVCVKAIEIINATISGDLARILAEEGMKEVLADSLLSWDGTIVEPDYVIRGTSMAETTVRKAHTGNLTGN